MTDKNKTLFLIDGSAFVYRAFHAIRSLSNSNGHPTNATFGFTRILLKLFREKQPEYAGVFFDVKGPTFRHKIFDEYKANRPPMPDDLVLQIPDIKRVTHALNIPVVEKQGFEADDLVGTFARIAQEQGFQVVMVTGDKDFIQLITKQCSLWDPMKDTVKGYDSVKEEMGIEPASFVEVLGLAGDTADNIPGVKGVGPKTAVGLIRDFGSIASLYENLDSLKKKKKLHENLASSRDLVDLSLELARIDQHVAVEQSLEDFRLTEFDTEQAFQIFQELEFKTLAREFSGKADTSRKNYGLITDVEGLKELAKKLEQAEIFAIDTETTSIHPVTADLVGISLSFCTHEAFYIPLGHVDEDSNLLAGQLSRQDIFQHLVPILENPDIKKIGQNIKYDYIVLTRYGICLQGISFDTMVASYLLKPAARGHGLDQIAMDLFGHKMISYEDITGKGKKQIAFAQVPLDKALTYAAEDADLTFMAYEKLHVAIQEQGLASLFETIEMPLITVLAQMEMKGILVDTEKLDSLHEIFSSELATLEQEIYEIAGETFNINSSQQLGTILFEKLGLTAVKKTKKKTGYSTDVHVLTKLAQSHELPERLLRYRTLDKLLSTYVEALHNLINTDTGRVHTSFNQTVTVTGRLSSSNPNLQNIPVRKPEGKKIRETFVPKQDYVLICADYSQIELRILAHCAEDPILIESFTNGEDIHQRTAIEVFQIIPELITDDLRSQAKAINFGIIYGMGAFKLSNELNISRKMAATYIDNYFARYAGVKKFIDDTIEQTKETCETTTIFGRKRRLDDIHSSNAHVRNFAQRAAINTPIQGSAADLIKLAMIRMQEALEKEKMASCMLSSVHDEIIFETPKEETEDLIALARNVMEHVHPLKVALKVNFGVGQNWAEAGH